MKVKLTELAETGVDFHNLSSQKKYPGGVVGEKRSPRWCVFISRELVGLVDVGKENEIVRLSMLQDVSESQLSDIREAAELRFCNRAEGVEPAHAKEGGKYG